VSVQLAAPAPAGVTVRVGAASSAAPWCETRPACVIVGQVPVPAIFAESAAVFNGPVIVMLWAVFADAWATVKTRVAGDATRGAGVGLPLAPGAGDALDPGPGEVDAFGAAPCRPPSPAAVAGTPEASATGAPEVTAAGGTAAWPGAGWMAVDWGGIPPICWFPVCTAGSEELSIPEQAASSDAVARVSSNLDVRGDNTKDSRRADVRGEARRDASLARR
jgi:hypothetical protein